MARERAPYCEVKRSMRYHATVGVTDGMTQHEIPSDQRSARMGAQPLDARALALLCAARCACMRVHQ